ncbi:hypothetical protein [Porcipelethomonas sp.]|uniref:hypothetical protein n=1 Tax=Porcipelethomonas sp. TaxID=2981675 RepID=UPI003EF35EFA
MADYTISSANLNGIERDLNSIDENLRTVYRRLETVDSNVDVVNDNVKVIYNDVESLARDFHQYVYTQLRANAKSNSQQRLIQIRQELEKKFGHYDVVRRTTTGILQADDLGIVKKSTITNATEELMITTPRYWLAPCLVALAAWINDQPELAEKAVNEALKRDDEKTSLFWALICRRADRKSSSLKWTQRYLANQDAEDLDRKTIIILDAFASGLLGADSEGVISRQMTEWLDYLSEKPGFVEQQTKQWSEAISLKKKPYSGSYTYLTKYSKTWPVLQQIMEGAMLHAELLEYFTNIFNQEASTDSLKEQLDNILNDLVNDFDEEEVPLRKEEKYNQFVVDFEGDEDRASKYMKMEESAFDEHKDFTQLLTDAAMKPESSHSSVSTQKFAIALSKGWISNAYNDIVAKNRMNIPNEIEINVDTFNTKTRDGKDEQRIIKDFCNLVENEKKNALSDCYLSQFERYCLFGGIAIAVIGLIMMLCKKTLVGIIAIIAGIGLVIKHFSAKKNVEVARNDIISKFDQKRKSGCEIIRATLAEIVDFRKEFEEKDGESQKVIDFLDQITPEQYVRKLSDSNRRIKISD